MPPWARCGYMRGHGRSGTRLIGDGDASKLFHMQTNLRFGCVILRHYIDREKRRPVHGAGALQRQPRQAAIPQRGFRRQQIWDFTSRHR
jgi:hypothetical protein